MCYAQCWLWRHKKFNHEPNLALNRSSSAGFNGAIAETNSSRCSEPTHFHTLPAFQQPVWDASPRWEMQRFRDIYKICIWGSIGKFSIAFETKRKKGTNKWASPFPYKGKTLLEKFCSEHVTIKPRLSYRAQICYIWAKLPVVQKSPTIKGSSGNRYELLLMN